LLVVDPALEDEYAVGLAQLAGGGIDRVEDDRLGASGQVVEPKGDHRVALLRGQLLDRGDDPANRDDLAVATALEGSERTITLAFELAGDLGQRVLGDPQTQRFLLQAQQPALLVFVQRDGRLVARPLGSLVDEIEDRALPRAAGL